MSHGPLDQLLARACAGDVDAIGALLNRQRSDLRRLAEEQLPAIVQKRIDASDLVQQTCLSVFRDMTEFTGADSAQFAAWVRKIHERNIQNAIRDQLQAQRRAVQRENPGTAIDQLPATAPSASEVVRQAALAEGVVASTSAGMRSSNNGDGPVFERAATFGAPPLGAVLSEADCCRSHPEINPISKMKPKRPANSRKQPSRLEPPGREKGIAGRQSTGSIPRARN